MKYLDKTLRKFINASAFIILLLIAAILGFICFINYLTLAAYNQMFFILLLLTILITLLFLASVMIVFYMYTKKHASSGFLWIARISLRFLLPFIYIASAVLRQSGDMIRGFYINVNNILVESGRTRYFPEEVMVVLPHCLQHSDCRHKITSSIGNCRKCGKCCIGDIAAFAEEIGVEATVVTGGTAARKELAEKQPKLVLAIACERDLSGGIADASKIPVIGLINKRPNGPCVNTTIDVNELKQKIHSVIYLKENIRGKLDKDNK